MAGPQHPRIPTMRLSRPYETEDDLIEGDFASLGRPWIILPDVPILPVGELVRFEVLLSNGAPAIRGEGHVVAYHPPGGPKPPGLEVKFTRIDARTKSIIERVHTKRLALRTSSMPPSQRPEAAAPPPEAPAAQTPTPIADGGSRDAPDMPKEDLSDVHAAEAAAPASAQQQEQAAHAASPEFAPPPAPAPEQADQPAVTVPVPPPEQADQETITDPAPPPEQAAPATAPHRAVAAPPNRNEILDRLRARAKDLPPEKRFSRSRGA
jgi:hypothetical protein